MPVNWLDILGAAGAAGRGYGAAKFGRPQPGQQPPGQPGQAPAAAPGGGGIVSMLRARQQRQQQPPPGFAQATRPYNPLSAPLPAAAAGNAPPPMAEPPMPGPGASPGLMNPVPGGSGVPGVPGAPMQGPAPPAMPPSGMPPPPGMGGPPPGAGGPPSPPGMPPTNPYRQGQGGDDNDDGSADYGEADERMANGGVVNKPTTALLGEDGPEMVVPLNRRAGNKVSLANLPGQRPPGLPPTAPGGGAPPPRAPMISPAMRYRSRLR